MKNNKNNNNGYLINIFLSNSNDNKKFIQNEG